MTTDRLRVRDWLPPSVVQLLRRLSGRTINFEGNFASWSDANAQCTGYSATDILEPVLAATLKVKSGKAACERDSVIFDKIEYAWPALASLMWAAARNGGNLNVLDFGGSLGSSYFQNRKFLQALPNFCWNVVEQAHYVTAGRAHIQNQQLRFYFNIAECLRDNQPNVILLSSVLQYLEWPFEVVAELSSSDATCLIVDRTPFSANGEDTITIQKVPPTIYSASYPMWIFSEQEFIRALSTHWQLIASNLSPEGTVQSNAGLRFSFQGMLFERRR